ncbi:hypothetical protein CC85DRAFT_66437 [Cutaneotrichosporon oleaginosum]|uniref:REJ domain-containing protein n=1 Tax=Cutaneotrichosporon oleaginosum TaxID=879819 RepID=A0A0J0XQ55_9TREE|nr:uncharacterized protein CC85DRAFT_66437 [Cutaneotrichosporon oleaginosum]KLT43251.1 hypothetical protein CC85DRAFT_66437 [Cutaneotrichosporon oleaginosum]TXT09930.1 hypothetical protein COLE_03864 [Cutaneotrichosporon oleaginosum]
MIVWAAQWQSFLSLFLSTALTPLVSPPHPTSSPPHLSSLSSPQSSLSLSQALSSILNVDANQRSGRSGRSKIPSSILPHSPSSPALRASCLGRVRFPATPSPTPPNLPRIATSPTCHFALLLLPCPICPFVHLSITQTPFPRVTTRLLSPIHDQSFLFFFFFLGPPSPSPSPHLPLPSRHLSYSPSTSAKHQSSYRVYPVSTIRPRPSHHALPADYTSSVAQLSLVEHCPERPR